MPGSKVFVDTNTVLYLHDRKEAVKGAVVGRWIAALADQNRVQLNLQVLNEATTVMTRGQWFDSPRRVFEIVDDLAEWGAKPLGWREVETARFLHLTHRYSWWDCLLLASALELGCTHFLSEDLQDGQRIAVGGKALTIVSPFAHTPDKILSLQD
jgi:predicted nucleic acid-binding protein